MRLTTALDGRQGHARSTEATQHFTLHIGWQRRQGETGLFLPSTHNTHTPAEYAHAHTHTPAEYAHTHTHQQNMHTHTHTPAEYAHAHTHTHTH